MIQYLVKRLLIALPVLLGVTVITFTIIQAAPGDAVDLMVDPHLTAEDFARRRAELGLDKHPTVQYMIWLKELSRGNLGYSFMNKQPVMTRIADRIAPTLILSLSSLALAYLIAIPIGIISAVRQYSVADYLSMILALIGVSIPNFFLGMGLIYIFSLKLDLTPVSGMYTLGVDKSLGDLLLHLALPAFVLAGGTIGAVTRFTRSAMLEVIRQDYIRTARSKGLNEKVVVYKHGLRNALIPVLTLIGLSLPTLLSGAIITEQVFAWPGMGRLALEAITQRDYPVLMALNLMTAVLVVFGGLLSDFLYSLADPRIRYT